MFLRNMITRSTGDYSKLLERLGKEISTADAVVIGAGAGLSTSAGFTYSGERFIRYFADFHSKYRYTDMYSGGFYPYDTLEENWGFWSRYIYINRYTDALKDTYSKLFELVRDKDYFVLTTNVDHQFQKAGFDKHRLFYTQGDYGLWQCSEPCHSKTYDNRETVTEMVLSQGFKTDESGVLYLPEGVMAKMSVPSELVPHCPICGKPMSMNLRADDTFVEDEGWHTAAGRYEDFIRRHKNLHILYLELGVGANTPVIIKYPFWQMTAKNPNAVYACINYGESFCPQEIEERSICLNRDIAEVVDDLSGVLPQPLTRNARP